MIFLLIAFFFLISLSSYSNGAEPVKDHARFAGINPEESTREHYRKLAEEKAAFVCVMRPLIEKAKDLVREGKQSHHLPVLALAGCSASGKSTLTRKLVSVLGDDGVNIVVFEQDNFNQPTLLIKPLVHPLAHHNFDPYWLHETMKQVLAGKEHITIPIWWHGTWKNAEKREVDVCFKGADLILFEGTYTLCGPETGYDFLKYSQCRAFLDVPEEDVLAQNWEREMRDAHPRTREKFDADVAWDMQDYRDVILPSKKNADFVIIKDKDHNYQIFTAM